MSKTNQQQMFDGILHWQQSGLSQKAWCEQNDMPYSSFHYWYRRFRNQQPDIKQGKANGFVQVLVQDRSPGAPWCEVVLGDGNRIFFHQPVPVELIRSLLD